MMVLMAMMQYDTLIYITLYTYHVQATHWCGSMVLHSHYHHTLAKHEKAILNPLCAPYNFISKLSLCE